MNFEHLSTSARKQSRFYKVKQLLVFLNRYDSESISYKKNMLKLGAITFDIIDETVDGFIINQRSQMRYIRQDTSSDDNAKFEVQLAGLKWKWDFSHILTSLIFFLFFLILLISLFYVMYCNYLPDFAYKDPKYTILVEQTIDTLFRSTSLTTPPFLETNYLIIDCMIKMCDFFNIFF